jgi:hypothetical protein
MDLWKRTPAERFATGQCTDDPLRFHPFNNLREQVFNTCYERMHFYTVLLPDVTMTALISLSHERSSRENWYASAPPHRHEESVKININGANQL